jgi:hypothetical protein
MVIATDLMDKPQTWSEKYQFLIAFEVYFTNHGIRQPFRATESAKSASNAKK